MAKQRYNYQQAANYLIQNGANNNFARFTKNAIFDLVSYPDDKRTYSNFMVLKTRFNELMRENGYELVNASKEDVYKVIPYVKKAKEKKEDLKESDSKSTKPEEKVVIDEEVKTVSIVEGDVDATVNLNPVLEVNDKTEVIHSDSKVSAEIIRLDGEDAPLVDRIEMKDLLNQIEENPHLIDPFNTILESMGWKAFCKLDLRKIG